MNGNGNKVQALRHQFEVLQCNESRIGKYAIPEAPKFGAIPGERRLDGCAGIMRAGNRSGYVDCSIIPMNDRLHEQEMLTPGLLVSDLNAQNYRNGIYVSSSITLHNDPPISSAYDSSYGSIQHPEDELLADDESQTGKSGSANDSGSQSGAGMYGKVKRSNAFRKKDVVDQPVETRPKPRGKMNVERVKSLDNGSNGKPRKNFETEINRASSVCVRPGVGNHSSESQKAVNVVAPFKNLDAPVVNKTKSAINYKSAQDLSSSSEDYKYGMPLIRNESLMPNRHPSPPPVPPLPSFYQPSYEYPCSTDRPLSVTREMRDPSTIHKTKSTSNLAAPPEKPPRTFLYDMFNDQALTQYQYQQRPLITKNAVVSKPQAHRHTNVSHNTSGPSGVITQGYLSSQNRWYSTNEESSKKGINHLSSVSNMANSKSSSMIRSDNANHQGLIRSKTESQIILKSKNRSWERGANFENEALPSKVIDNNNLLFGHPNMNCNAEMSPSNLLDGCDRKDPNLQLYTRPATSGTNSRLDRNGNKNFSGQHTHSPTHISPITVTYQQHRHVHEPQYGRVISTSDYNVRSGLAVGVAGRSATNRISEISIANAAMTDSGATVVGSNSGRHKRVSSAIRSKKDDRLSEKSKSEWALNEVLNEKAAITGVDTNGRRNTVSNATQSHISSSHNVNRTYHSNMESSGSSNSGPKNFHQSIPQSIQNLMSQLFAPNGKDATSSTDSGIQLGSESLSSCDTPVGDSTTDTGDSDVENEAETAQNARQVVEARKGYIRQVSSFRKELGTSYNRIIPSNRRQQKSSEPLFECLLIVGLNRDAYTGSYHPYVKEIFPPNAKLASGVEQFCFPDSMEWPCHEGKTAQSYTLAITDHRGGRKYGCCFRILPEGANICIPITYCLISSHRAIGFYREVLKEITRRHGCSEYVRRCWIEQLFDNSFPPPDGDVYINEPIHDGAYVMSGKSNTLQNMNPSVFNNYTPTKTITIRRKADHRLDDKDLVCLFSKVDVATVLKIFGSILHERKVVLLSRALSTLSLCIEALESMLYPFTWQHTFIPILPLNMPDILDAPSPFLIGVLRSTQSSWEKHFDDGIVVDLDSNKILRCVGDEGSILPKRIYRKLKDALHCVLTLPDQDESTKNVLYSECFIRMFVDMLGHYCNYVILQADGTKIFDRDSFVKSSESKATQNFLDWFSETSMFHFFIENRLNYNTIHGLFEQRIMGDQNGQAFGAPFKGKTSKGYRTFGINWLKDAFVMK